MIQIELDKQFVKKNIFFKLPNDRTLAKGNNCLSMQNQVATNKKTNQFHCTYVVKGNLASDVFSLLDKIKARKMWDMA